nr:MAG TPA: hypothetical protein [Caudoviricetes sp.]
MNLIISSGETRMYFNSFHFYKNYTSKNLKNQIFPYTFI